LQKSYSYVSKTSLGQEVLGNSSGAQRGNVSMHACPEHCI
jgi:hypothetical protein